jgi:NDP-hexose-3-ketoreductase
MTEKSHNSRSQGDSESVLIPPPFAICATGTSQSAHRHFPITPRPLNLGVMSCSSFALRAMVPAIAESPYVKLAAIASRDMAKATEAATKFDARALAYYQDLLDDPEIDAIYMPLPTGLHEEWVHKALDAEKHILVEKSLAMDFASASGMLAKARSKNLLLLENFLFPRHLQFSWAMDQIASKSIGELKFFRSAFTIPPLPAGNFRYNAALGGGALLDVGAYMVKSSLLFMGENLDLLSSTIEADSARGVDVRGTATFRNADGVIAQALWAFDTAYQCSWEFIGTEGRIVCERAFTPPPDFCPPIRIERGAVKESLELPADNHYKNQWDFFAQAARSHESIHSILAETEAQAKLLNILREAN